MTNTLADIDAVDWAAYSHAYGDASDVPDMIRRLLDSKECEAAVNDLCSSLLHQGTIYTATIPAVLFLAQVAAEASAPGRAGAFGLLTSYAESIQDGWTKNKLYLPKNTDLKAFDRDARAALAAAVPVVLDGLADADPERRANVAVFLERVEELPESAVAALRTQWECEDVPDVKAVLASALNAHGGLGEDVSGDSAAVRFTAAWSAVAAGKYSASDIDTVVDLWADQADWLEKSGVTDNAVSGLLGAAADAVPWLVRLAHTSGRAVADAFQGLGTLAHYRRDAFHPAAQALIELAESAQTLTDIDLPYNVVRTARDYLVFSLVNVEPGLSGADQNRLLNALARVVTEAPGPAHSRTAPAHSQLAQVIAQAGDPRADALPTLLGPIQSSSAPEHQPGAHPGWFELFCAVLADSPTADVTCASWTPEMFGRSPLVATIASRLPNAVLPADQARQLADLAATELGRDNDYPTSIQWFELLRALPDEVTRPVQSTVLAALRAIPHSYTMTFGGQLRSQSSPLVKTVAPTLLRWKVPGTEELFDEWAREEWPQSCWAQLALGVLTDDQRLLDQATAKGLPELWAAEFIALAGDCRSVGLTQVSRTLITGKAATSRPGCNAQLSAARVVADADGISAVWPTVLAVIDAQKDPLEAALAAALSLLNTHGPALDCLDELTKMKIRLNPLSRRLHGPALDCRDALTRVLRQVVDAGPREAWDGKDYQGPVRAAGALLDLGEPVPELSVKHSLTLLRQLARTFGHSTFLAVPEACRLLGAFVPGLAPAPRKRALAALEKLLDSPLRVGFGNTMIAQDTSFTNQLTTLVKSLQ